jgi:hypothetical protein
LSLDGNNVTGGDDTKNGLLGSLVEIRHGKADQPVWRKLTWLPKKLSVHRFDEHHPSFLTVFSFQHLRSLSVEFKEDGLQ